MSEKNESEPAADEQEIPDVQVSLTFEELGILIGCCAYVTTDMTLVDEYKQEAATLIKRLFPDLDASLSETVAFDFQGNVGSRVDAVAQALLTKGKEALQQEGGEGAKELQGNLSDLVLAWCESFKNISEARLNVIGPVLGHLLTENAGRGTGINI